MQMKWIQLLIQCFMLTPIKCGSHSLYFLSTGRISAEQRPLFEQLTLFDGAPISYCDSLTKREELKPCLESKNMPEKCDEAHDNILGGLIEIYPLINNTLYVQRRRGCNLSANGIVSTVDAWAVNGMDFISFDTESQRWTAQSLSAVSIEHSWNNDIARNHAFRHFIIEKCPLLIQGIKLRSAHQETEVRVFAKPIVETDQALLTCHVTSTDMSVSSVQLIQDQVSKASLVHISRPMPSEDRSVILRLTARIPLHPNSNAFGCSVQTGSHKIVVFWDGDTVDGRDLLNMTRTHWKMLIIIVGFLSLVLTITAISCTTALLLKCVRKKSHRPSSPDPELTAQFISLKPGVMSADLHNIIITFTKGTEGDGEWDQWKVRIDSRDSRDSPFYDSEYFAGQVDE